MSKLLQFIHARKATLFNESAEDYVTTEEAEDVESDEGYRLILIL
jgi:hypothetical protein